MPPMSWRHRLRTLARDSKPLPDHPADHPDALIARFHEEKCGVCGRQLRTKSRFDYVEPFVPAPIWCPEHGYRWEWTSDEQTNKT